MWFGNLVTMRWWDDLWLNESFAELMGLHTVEEATEYDGAWADFALARKAWGYRADSLPTTHPIAGTGARQPGRADELRRHLLRQGRVRASPALGVDRRGRRSSPAYAATSTGTPGATPRSPTCSPRWRRSPDATSTDWSRSWLRTAGTSTIRVRDGLLESDDDRPHHVGVGRYAGHPLRLVRAPRPRAASPDERVAAAVDRRAGRPGAAQRRRPDLRQGAARRTLAR